MRGDIDSVQIKKNPLKYLGNKEIYNNWKDLSTNEIYDAGMPKLSS